MPLSACAMFRSIAAPKETRGLEKPFPGYSTTTLKSGFSTGIVADTCVLTFDIYMLGHKGLSNEVVNLRSKRFGITSTSCRRSMRSSKTGPANAPHPPM